jgi:hypothetical protein
MTAKRRVYPYSPNCQVCGNLRTVRQIRELVGAEDGEDVVAVVARMMARLGSRKAQDATRASSPTDVLQSAPQPVLGSANHPSPSPYHQSLRSY